MSGRVLFKVIALLATTLAALSPPLGASAGFPRYRLTPLGCLPGRNVAVPTAINNRGVIVGYSYQWVAPGHLASSLSSPFVWEKGRMRELKTLGGPWGHAYAVNNRGDVVGSAQDKKATRAVIWRRITNYRPEPLAAAAGIAMHLDDAGTIAGVLEFERRPPGDPLGGEAALPELRDEGGGDGYPVVWKRGIVSRFERPPGDNVRLTGLSPAGQPVGHTYRTTMISHQERAYRWRGGKPEILPTLGGDESVAEAVSSQGLIIGWSEDRAGHRHATLWREGRPEALAAAYTLQDNEYAYSAAHGINRKGAIVGEAGGACLWLDGQPVLLSKRVRALGNWSLWRAAAINDSGCIIGTGLSRSGRVTDGFLLTPL